MSEWHDIVYTGKDLLSQSANCTPNSNRSSSWCYKASKRRRHCRVKAEEKDSKSRPDKSTRRVTESSSQLRRRDTLATKVKSPSKPKLVRGNNYSEQVRANKQYSFKDRHIVSLFKLFHKINKLKLSEVRRPEEVDKIDNPNYCLYHRMLRLFTKVATSLKMYSRL